MRLLKRVKVPRKLKKAIKRYIYMTLIGDQSFPTKYIRKADNWMKRQQPRHHKLSDPVILMSAETARRLSKVCANTTETLRKINQKFN